ncbi:MAG TPA: hypothetical protein DEF34_11195 [Desulfotomaculum sp.]|nr:MAG: hypothetical protein JL56_14305 [Desulfotomaculum sp. BICA1-6]HBX24178.1 hypothetical protein [Desulfotomaculum sp.]
MNICQIYNSILANKMKLFQLWEIKILRKKSAFGGHPGWQARPETKKQASFMRPLKNLNPC